MIILDQYAFKKEKEMDSLDKASCYIAMSKAMLDKSTMEYFNKFNSINFIGDSRQYFIFKYPDESHPIGIYSLYSILPEDKSLHTSMLLFKDYTDLCLDNTTVPIYAYLIIHAGLYLYEHPEELGFNLETIYAEIITLKNDPSLDVMLRYSHLRRCREDIILAGPEFRVDPIGDEHILHLKYSCKTIASHKNEYMK